MMAFPPCHRGHVIPAHTDHLDDTAGRSALNSLLRKPLFLWLAAGILH